MDYDNERAWVKISKGKVGGQSPAATRIKPLVSPARGNALNSPRKNVITHVKCCPPGKLTMLGCPGISLGCSPMDIHLPGVCSRIQSPIQRNSEYLPDSSLSELTYMVKVVLLVRIFHRLRDYFLGADQGTVMKAIFSLLSLGFRVM